MDRFLSVLAAIGVACSAVTAEASEVEPTDSTSSLRLDLNVAARRLEVYDGDSLLRTLRVAVGMRRYPTPTGTFTVSWVEWNPWWIPPESPWAKDEKVTPPGPDNPMGRVKIGFGPLYFLHGTPWPESIGRAASHGCVRMLNEDAVGLAVLLQLRGVTAPDSVHIRALANDTLTHRAALRQQPKLDVRYETVEIRGDSLHLWLDTYRRAPVTLSRILTALAARGVDTATVDRRRLRTLAARAATRPQVVSLSALSTPR